MILSQIWSLFTAPTKKVEKINFYELVLVCWIFYIIKTTYSVVLHNFSLTFKHFSFWPSSISFFESQVFLYWTLIGCIFYPIYLLLIKEIWVFIINFFKEVFNIDADSRLAEELLMTSFSSHILLAIPVIGIFFHQLVHLIYLYLGLRKRMLMSRLQSILVIISPFLFIALFAFFIIVVFVVFISILQY
jgi:hypothetical protein